MTRLYNGRGVILLCPGQYMTKFDINLEVKTSAQVGVLEMCTVFGIHLRECMEVSYLCHLEVNTFLVIY